MRTAFADSVIELGKKDKDLFFLTGDLGFHALEGIRETIKERFINAGVAEVNMIDVAAGMAKMGLNVWTYSIATFLILKTVEQIRNNLNHPNLPVKLIGNGGGYGYGIMGESHHLLEDIAILSSFPNIRIFVPAFVEDVKPIVTIMNSLKSPSYLRLNNAPKTDVHPTNYKPVRKIRSGKEITIVTLGPLTHNAITAIDNFNKKDAVDLFCVTELPITNCSEILDSVKKTKKIFILEEHTGNGGLGENIFSKIATSNIKLDKSMHFYARGYVKNKYGCHEFMQRQNELDSESILKNLKKMYDSK